LELLTLEEVKSYLRVEHSEEDFFLAMLIQSSVSYCETYLNRPLITTNMTLENEWDVPESVRLAILMLVAHWYDNRGVVGQVKDEMHFSVTALLNPYRYITFGGGS